MTSPPTMAADRTPFQRLARARSMQRGERSGRLSTGRIPSDPAFVPSVKGHHRRRPPYSEPDSGESRGILGLTW